MSSYALQHMQQEFLRVIAFAFPSSFPPAHFFMMVQRVFFITKPSCLTNITRPQTCSDHNNAIACYSNFSMCVLCVFLFALVVCSPLSSLFAQEILAQSILLLHLFYYSTICFKIGSYEPSPTLIDLAISRIISLLQLDLHNCLIPANTSLMSRNVLSGIHPSRSIATA